MRLTAYNEHGRIVADWQANQPLTVEGAKLEINKNGFYSDRSVITGWAVDGVGIFTFKDGRVWSPMEFAEPCDCVLSQPHTKGEHII